MFKEYYQRINIETRVIMREQKKRAEKREENRVEKREQRREEMSKLGRQAQRPVTIPIQ